LQTQPPTDQSRLSRWRKRLGEADLKELFAQSIEAAKRATAIEPASIKRAIVDTTVMAKAITPPTDSALLEKSRVLLVKAARQYRLSLRQNFNRLTPRLVRQVAQYAHARQYKRMRRALRALRPRARRVQRDIEQQLQRVPLEAQKRLDELLGRTRRILQQRLKGKARVRYGFGLKVSIVTALKEGLAVGVRAMLGKPYHEHTLHEALEQAAIPSGVGPEMVFVDRGYNGVEVEHF
jgi:IS5 family transposase